jgi:6-phosphofructokinase 1
MVDAKTTSRWYFVVAMGRKAGHLALGIGKSAGATITLIGEEFTAPIRLRTVVDTLAGAIIKRLSYGRRDGVAIIAEGIVLGIPTDEIAALETAERDAHGHIRIDEVSLGDILKAEVTKRLREHSIKATISAKNIGYELRCADPIPLDMEYTRDLGYSAAGFLLTGGSSAMISMQGGRLVPIPFDSMIDPETGRTRVRAVDIDSTRYQIAKRYMIRLRKEDFDDPHDTARLATIAHCSIDEFRAKFSYLTGDQTAAAVRSATVG